MKNYQKLAELIGIIQGDGNLNKTSNCITIVGSLEEYGYFKNYVIPLIESLFDVEPKLRKRNDRNAFYIDLNSKEMMNYLTNKIGLVRGSKINAHIPMIIKNNIELIPHFLRGLFDTDGCLKFSKQRTNRNFYPRIQYCFKDTFFSKEVFDLLLKIGFDVGTWKEGGNRDLVFYQISGTNNLEKWMKTVGSNNLIHKTKYLIWKKKGFYTPKSSLESRLKTLSLNRGI